MTAAAVATDGVDEDAKHSDVSRSFVEALELVVGSDAAVIADTLQTLSDLSSEI